MSKNNVNPNHYKVAGRGRQGEDIVQSIHKQKHTQNLADQRTESGARAERPDFEPVPTPKAVAGAAVKEPSPGGLPTRKSNK